MNSSFRHQLVEARSEEAFKAAFMVQRSKYKSDYKSTTAITPEEAPEVTVVSNFLVIVVSRKKKIFTKDIFGIKGVKTVDEKEK